MHAPLSQRGQPRAIRAPHLMGYTSLHRLHDTCSTNPRQLATRNRASFKRAWSGQHKRKAVTPFISPSGCQKDRIWLESKARAGGCEVNVWQRPTDSEKNSWSSGSPASLHHNKTRPPQGGQPRETLASRRAGLAHRGGISWWKNQNLAQLRAPYLHLFSEAVVGSCKDWVGSSKAGGTNGVILETSATVSCWKRLPFRDCIWGRDWVHQG